ncbi:MAG TPA: hypothetical protein VFQ61_11955, partial [Polyangiaceae bacterium]|nr:hypothetical protein [Polyangiaceae bacterium]
MTGGWFGRRSFASAVFAGGVLATWTSFLHAAPGLLLDATPLLTQSEANSGWRSVLVRLENPSAQTLRGHVELASRPSWARATWAKTGAEFTTRVPFSLAPKARVSFEAPTRGFGEGAPTVRVTAVSETNEPLADVVMPSVHSADAVVLDLQNPSRVAAALRRATFVSDRTPPFASRGRVSELGVSVPQVDPTTSDLILPQIPAGYGG